MIDLKNLVKKVFIFSEPSSQNVFELKENDKGQNSDESDSKAVQKKSNKSGYIGNCSKKQRIPKLREKGEIKIKKPIKLDELIATSEKEKRAEDKTEQNSKTGDFKKKDTVNKQLLESTFIHSNIKDSLSFIKKIYSADINGDFKIREFKIHVKNQDIDAFIAFFDGMIDRTILNFSILQPLMTLSCLEMEDKSLRIRDFIKEHLMPQNQVIVSDKYKKIIDEINFGGVGLFIDGLTIAYGMDIKGWEHRQVSRPNTELIIRGPQEAFNEVLRMNTALLRKILKDEDLIFEDILVGKRSKTPCSLAYIKDIANPKLVNEVRKRLKNISIDYVTDSGEVEQFIEDSTFSPVPQVLASERPDRVASLLSEGRVGVLVHGSPFVLVMPVTFFNLLHASADKGIRFPYSTFLRLIRLIGMFFALLLPGLYLAITEFHNEIMPTDLLLAIASAREKVPFPSLIGIIIMEVSFELIREAGIRIPGPIGPTLGIVGALILGQAAVAANLVSPILIIVVAVTGLGSFAIPEYSLGYTLRLYRFLYIFLGSFAGLLGITLGVFVQLLFVVNTKSFGVPFLSPFAPKTTGTVTDTVVKTPIWMQEDRPDYLSPQDIKREKKISRTWRN